MQQYFIDSPVTGNTLILADDRIYHHVVQVMRMQVGAKFEIVTPKSQVYQVNLTKISTTDKQLYLQVQKQLNRTTELPVKVTLVCGLPKRDKTEWIVQKATELGAHQIIFFPAKWSVPHWDQKKSIKKIQRLQAIALNAGEQSHRNTFPKIAFESLNDVLKLPADSKLIAYEESAKNGEYSHFKQHVNQLLPDQNIICVFGPEGGIAPEEVAALKAAGFDTVGLGPRILRTETAPLYFLSSLSYALELKV